MALLRAELDRPRTPEGDPGAQRALCRGMRPIGPLPMRPQIAARTRFFDPLVMEAISAGLRQVVICVRLLAGLRSRAAPGSALAASLAVHGEGADTAQVIAAANGRWRTGQTEPWRTILPLGAHLKLLTQGGWRVERLIDAVELDSDAAAVSTQLVTTTPVASSTVAERYGQP